MNLLQDYHRTSYQCEELQTMNDYERCYEHNVLQVSKDQR